MIPLGLEVFRFARNVSTVKDKTSVPLKLVDDPYIGFIFDSPFGYYMPIRLVFEQFMYEHCKKQLEAVLEPSLVKICLEENIIMFPTLPDVFHGLLAIFEVLNIRYQFLFEDRVNVFTRCVQRLDEVMKLVELNIQMNKLSLSQPIKKIHRSKPLHINGIIKRITRMSVTKPEDSRK